MEKIFTEENGIYAFDCRKAIWATDNMHNDYQAAGVHIKDTDLLIENDTDIFMVEYKNALIASAVNPNAFQPDSDKKINDVSRKFYDSLHYLKLLGKDKPVSYVYVLEYPNGDVVTRKRLRNKLKPELPFTLQDNVGDGRQLIKRLDVVSIQEWNDNEKYGKYPLQKVSNEE